MQAKSQRKLLFLIATQICASGVAAQDWLSNAGYHSPTDVPALTVSGSSGGLTIPDGRVLPDGTVALGFNNAFDPRFFRARQSENYLLGVGLLPHVELSGRLINYPLGASSADFVARDLAASVKLSLPIFFRWQPDIAFGINDLAGGNPLYRSKYIVASQTFGPLRATVGKARGEASLNGVLAGAELSLGGTGLSLLAERNDRATYAGIRYASRPIAELFNASVVATAHHSFGIRTADGSKFDRTTLGVNLVIPFGENARNIKTPEPPSDVIWTPPPAYVTRAQRTSNAPEQVIAAAGNASTPKPAATIPEADLNSSLRKLQAALEKTGLERIRVGVAGEKLVIEYENHRYNQNEVDAIGIALALGATFAPGSITRVAAVTKKSGLVLYETSVDRASYHRYLVDNDPWAARESLEFRRRPRNDGSVVWLDDAEGRRGYSRVLIEPLLKSFVGTEVGVFDYSLAANVQGIVPLWKGANFHASYVSNIADSANVRSGDYFYARQRTGLKSVALSQSLWLNDYMLNVISGGKFLYDYAGIQNETILFVPGRDDQVRLEYTKLRYSDAFNVAVLESTGIFYRWTYQPLNLWVEGGYSQYVEKDRGPSIKISRWFGDIQAQAHLRHSDRGTYAGFQLAFPLTPRRGMQPGYTHFEGPSQFAYGLETKVANKGSANFIVRGIAEEIPITYSSRNLLLNQGRVGKNYVFDQLPRMREAALLYAPLE